MRRILTLLCLLAAVSVARADAPTASFGGQSYHLDYQDAARLPDGQPGNGLAEFTLAGETVQDWSKLFAYYAYPEAGDDPLLMAAEVGKAAKEANPDANYALLDNKEAGDAIIDFLTWAPGSEIGEFNVFKFARAQYGPGLVGLQFAQRFKVADMDVKDFQALRKRAVAEMARTDIAQVRHYFAEKAKERLGAAGVTNPQGGELPAGAPH